MSRLSVYYDRDASTLAARYETVSFEMVHGPILRFLPHPGANIADVGAGGGRDARALAEMGYHVLAIEPSIEMRQHGVPRSPPNLRWCDDSLPGLKRVRSTARRFEFVLCSAVLMHLEAEALPACFEALAALLSEHGHLAISLRDERLGDPEGLYFDHSPETVLSAAASTRLQLMAQGSSSDSLARSDVLWRWFIFIANDARGIDLAQSGSANELQNPDCLSQEEE